MTDPEVKMTIKTLARRGVAKRDIARQLSLNEGTVRYHLKRLEAGAVDGRTRQRRLAADFEEAIEHWRTSAGDSPRITNSAELHEWLVVEHDYGGSLRSLQRYLAERYPAPPRRTRRRVETPPGAQAQVDWGHFPGVLVGGHEYTLNAFVQVLSFSRMPAISWSYSLDLSSWLHCHNATFRQLGGIAAVLRVDNCKTAVAHGAGAW